MGKLIKNKVKTEQINLIRQAENEVEINLKNLSMSVLGKNFVKLF
jgi:hypothetical protein